jgi:hypothetical protein
MMKYLILSLIIVLKGQTATAFTEISFTPLAPICSTDTLNCSQWVDYPFTINGADLSDLQLSYQLAINGGNPQVDPYGSLQGSAPSFYISGNYPIGSYQLLVEVIDVNGVLTTASLGFEVLDCIAPMVTCLDSLEVELWPVQPYTDVDGDGDFDLGANAIYAQDLILNNLSTCSDSLSFSINRMGDVPVRGQEVIIVTCDDPQEIIVQIYAWDNAINPYSIQPNGTLGGSNYDYCEIVIDPTDDVFCICHGGGCGGDVYISGLIRTENGIPLDEVNVELTGDVNAIFITDTSGAYEFLSLELFQEYSVKPYKDGNYQNGVSTFDLVLIQKHILGIELLDSPYKIVAADVNNSESISTLDLIFLRRLILNLDSTLSAVPPWRFIKTYHNFIDPLNPWSGYLPERINFNYLYSSYDNQDFIAVKMGDVNNSVDLDD